jgi:protein TonB
VLVIVLILLPFAAKAVFEPRNEMTLYLMDPPTSAPVVEPVESAVKPESSLTRMDQPKPAHHALRTTHPQADRAASRPAVTSVSKTVEPASPLVPRFIEMPRSFDTAGPRLLTDGQALNLPDEMISSAGPLPNLAIVSPPSRPVLAAAAGSRHVFRDGSAERVEAARSKAKPGQNVRPEYPRIAQEAGWEGTVMLHVEVLPDGKAGMVSVELTSGHAVLDNAALNAVQRWRFSPAMDGNFPIKSVVRLPVRFDLRAQ